MPVLLLWAVPAVIVIGGRLFLSSHALSQNGSSDSGRAVSRFGQVAGARRPHSRSAPSAISLLYRPS